MFIILILHIMMLMVYMFSYVVFCYVPCKEGAESPCCRLNIAFNFLF